MKHSRMSNGMISAIILLALCPILPAQDERADSRVDEAVARRRKEIQAAVERRGITDNLWGAGSWLVERGIRLEAAATFFAQDPVAGESEAGGKIGGKLDGLLRLDLHKLGLWKGLSLTAHPEYNFGDASNGFGGTVLPVNVALQLPGVTSGNRYDISSLFLTQRFNDTFTLILGKTNLADIAAFHPYAGGAGLTGFMNAGLVAAPNGAVPPYVYGGVLLAKTKRAVFSLALYGGDNAQGSFSPRGALDDGFLLSAGVSVPVNPGGLPGKQSLSFIWGDREARALDDLGDLILYVRDANETIDPLKGWVHDYETEEWVDLANAHFVPTLSVSTPMGHSIIAFAEADRAAAFAAEVDGEVIGWAIVEQLPVSENLVGTHHHDDMEMDDDTDMDMSEDHEHDDADM